MGYRAVFRTIRAFSGARAHILRDIRTFDMQREAAMLHSANKLRGFSVSGVDGEVGSVEDVYFDDERWVVRYLVVNAGSWLTGRQVLLSPLSLRHADWNGSTLIVNLTRDKIRSSPGIDTHMPVSRWQETELFKHYDYPYYWAGPYAWGFSVSPLLLDEAFVDNREQTEPREQPESDKDRHLRSCKEVKGYAIHASDATLGHLEDFLFDEEDWSIQMLVIDPRNWWPSKDVLVAPQRILSVNWEDKSVTLDMTRAEVEHSPQYDSSHPPLSNLPPTTHDSVPRPDG